MVRNNKDNRLLKKFSISTKALQKGMWKLEQVKEPKIKIPALSATLYNIMVILLCAFTQQDKIWNNCAKGAIILCLLQTNW